MIMKCKKCSSENYVKYGFFKGRQRYRCKECKCVFIEQDNRRREVKKNFSSKLALALMCYGVGKCSIRFIAKLLKIPHTTVYYWLKDFTHELPEPEIPETIIDVEFDEMWHFLKKNLKSSGSSERFVGFQSKPWDGLQVTVIIKHSRSSTKNLNI